MCAPHRLLREKAPALNRLPGQWLTGLLQRVRASGQGRDDIVRRSAGLPYAFVALFLAEPPGPSKARPIWVFMCGTDTIFDDVSCHWLGRDKADT